MFITMKVIGTWGVQLWTPTGLVTLAHTALLLKIRQRLSQFLLELLFRDELPRMARWMEADWSSDL
jgi:hypothetical protein